MGFGGGSTRRGLRTLLVALVAALPLLAVADSGGEWHLVRDEDGIQLSRRSGERPTFRAVAVLEASLPHVLAVIRDVPRHVEWRSRCVESRILSVESRKVATLYNRIEGSWPVAHRDAVLRSETRVAGPEAASIQLRSVESPEAPDPDGAVRMRLEGAYELRSEGPERTRVDYRMQIELGGYVPRWLASFATEDMPVATLEGLRRQVAATRGAYDEFVRAWPEAAVRGELPIPGDR